LRRVLGNKVLDIEIEEGSTVSDVVGKVIEIGGDEIRHLIMTKDKISGNLIIMLNQADVNTLDGLKTQVNEGDTVSLLPHIQGG
jgi:molybdopterin converting factor small subunit